MARTGAGVEIMAAVAPLLARYIRSYAAFLKLQKMPARTIREELRAARAFLAFQTETQPAALVRFRKLVPAPASVSVAEYLAVLASTRFVPLNENARELFQAYAANTGKTHAAKLRNAALISLLLNPTPPRVRPFDILQIQRADLSVNGEITSYKARGLCVPLNENARGFLTRYMTEPDGYQAIRPASCRYIWPTGNKDRPMTRQSLHALTSYIGNLCGIRGRVGADILRKTENLKHGKNDRARANPGALD